MAENFGQVKQWILYQTNKDGSDFDYGVSSAIQSAIIFMESNYNWLFQTTTQLTIAAGQNATNLPEDFAQLIDLQYYIGNVLYGSRSGFVQIPFIDLNALVNSTAESGYPQKYALFNDQVYVYPATSSSTNLLIHYQYKDEFYPTNNSDASIWFGDQTIDCIRFKALELFYRTTLQSPDVADKYFNTFTIFENALVAKNNNRSVNQLLSI